jgi:K+-sensing histidine kinase KdpD
MADHAAVSAAVGLRALAEIIAAAANAPDARILLDEVVRAVERSGLADSVTASLDGSDAEPAGASAGGDLIAGAIVSDNRSIGRIELVPNRDADSEMLRALVTAAGQSVGAAVERLGLKAEARRLRDAVDNVVLRATHDLRGPVSALGVAASSLVDRRDLLTLEQQHRLLELIGKSVEDLRDAIARLPATARAEEARGSAGWTHR